MRFSPLTTFVVGIDPGSSTGYAFLSRKQNLKLINSGTSNFYDIQDLLESVFPNKKEVKIFIELPPLFTYSRNRNEKDDKAKGGDLMAMRIGGNRRESELLKIGLERRGFQVESVAPIGRNKWNQGEFERHTGSRKRTSEHERDATRLVMHYANKRELEDELFAKI